MHSFDFVVLGASLLVCVGMWFWCLYRAYPIYLDFQVRRGKSWVYLPRFWQGSRRTQIRLGTRLIRFLFTLAVSAILWVFLSKLALPKMVVWSLCIGVGIFAEQFLYRFLVRSRYTQQEKFYFGKLQNQLRLYDEQGRHVNEAEVRNLISWEHQSALRRADEAGELHRVLQLHLKARR